MKLEYISMALTTIVAISAIISNVLKIKIDSGTLTQRPKTVKKSKPAWNRIFTYGSAILLWAYLALSSEPVSRPFVVSVNVVTAFFIVNVIFDIVSNVLARRNNINDI